MLDSFLILCQFQVLSVFNILVDTLEVVHRSIIQFQYLHFPTFPSHNFGRNSDISSIFYELKIIRNIYELRSKWSEKYFTYRLIRNSTLASHFFLGNFTFFKNVLKSNTRKHLHVSFTVVIAFLIVYSFEVLPVGT